MPYRMFHSTITLNGYFEIDRNNQIVRWYVPVVAWNERVLISKDSIPVRLKQFFNGDGVWSLVIKIDQLEREWKEGTLPDECLNQARLYLNSLSSIQKNYDDTLKSLVNELLNSGWLEEKANKPNEFFINSKRFVVKDDIIYIEFNTLGMPVFKSHFFNETIKEPSAVFPAELNEFLRYVARGRQQEAENMLMKSDNQQQLLMIPGKLTDGAGRAFDISAYAYAFWAGDAYMIAMMHAYLCDEARNVLVAEIQSLINDGVSYTRNGNRVEHSKCFEPTEFYQAINEHMSVGPKNNIEFDRLTLANIAKSEAKFPAYLRQTLCFEGGGMLSGRMPSLVRETMVKTYTHNERIQWNSDAYSFQTGKGARCHIGGHISDEAILSSKIAVEAVMSANRNHLQEAFKALQSDKAPKLNM